jgi:hypothetical protein
LECSLLESPNAFGPFPLLPPLRMSCRGTGHDHECVSTSERVDAAAFQPAAVPALSLHRRAGANGMLHELTKGALVLSVLAGGLGVGGAARTPLTLGVLAASLLVSVLIILATLARLIASI